MDIPKELAERLYLLYEATLMNPVPFDEWDGDKFRRIFERGIVNTEEQLFWLYNNQARAANPEDPYDLGVLNALWLVMHVVDGREPVFAEKPPNVLGEIEKFQKREKSAKAKFDKLKKEKDNQISALEKSLKADKNTIKALRAELKKKK